MQAFVWKPKNQQIMLFCCSGFALKILKISIQSMRWLAHHPRLPLPQRWQAHQAGLSHHTGQLLSRNITKPDAVRIEDPAAAPSAKRGTQVKF